MSLRFSWLLAAVLAVNSLNATIHEGGDYEAGKTLFMNNCASCHSPKEGAIVAAPSLYNVAERWEGKDELLKIWVKNPDAAISTGDSYVLNLMKKYEGSFGKMAAQAVNDEEINHIFTYVAEYEDLGGGDVDAEGPCGNPYELEEEESESGNPVFWFLIIAVFAAIIAVAASGAGRAVQSSINERENGEPIPDVSYGERVKNWVWENKAVVSILSLVFVAFFLVPWGYNWALGINIMEDYRPSQPIEFNHKLHACANGIDCQYCHNSASKSKHAGLPEPMLCMNCHKGVKEGHNEEMTAEIHKIYEYVGFDPVSASYMETDTITGEPYEQKSIVWNKVHNLPDHVFFSHQQHVAVGGIECQNCHGPVDTKYTLGKVATSEEIQALAADDPNIIALENDVLTMGWCIECHDKAGIDVMNTENGYYQEIHDRLIASEKLGQRDLQKYLADKTITVKELGGWECSKCHY